LRRESARGRFFAKQEAFRTGDDEEIANKASGLSRLSNGVLVWHIVPMVQIIARRHAMGEDISAEEFGRYPPSCAPVMPNGNSLFNRARAGGHVLE
jgi:hypothetical protein